jgi:hypothetical protein
MYHAGIIPLAFSDRIEHTQTDRQMRWWWWRNRAVWSYIYISIKSKRFLCLSLLSRRYNEKNRLMFIFIFPLPFSLNGQRQENKKLLLCILILYLQRLLNQVKEKISNGIVHTNYVSAFYQSIRQHNLLNIYLFWC